MDIIIRKSKISWVIKDVSLVAFDRHQATAYHAFMASTRQPISRMKKKILNSKPDEYNSWVDVIQLATDAGVIGYGTKLRKEWLNDK